MILDARLEEDEPLGTNHNNYSLMETTTVIIE